MPNAGPIRLGAFHHGLEINPVFLLVMPGVQILSTNGELRLPVPATPLPTTIYAQALFASNNPGYAPGSFSNLLVATK